MKKFLSLILTVALVLSTIASVQIVSADSADSNYEVSADSYVDNSKATVKDKNFGDAEIVNVKSKMPGFMIFDLSSDLTGYSVENADLNLYIVSAPAGASVKIATITNPAYGSYAHWTDAKHWTESGLNARSITSLKEANSVTYTFENAVENDWVAIGIADLVNDEGDKIISLELSTESTTPVVIASKEAEGELGAKIHAYGELTEKPLVVESLTLDKNSVTLKAGVEKTQLTATIVPSYALNKTVIWTSSDEEVATVSASGLVTAVSAGEAGVATCTIRAESDENADIYDECTVTVEAVGGEGSTSYIIKSDYTTTYNNHWPNRDWSVESTNEIKGTGGSSRTSYMRFRVPEFAGYDIAYAQLVATAASAPIISLPITCRGFYNKDWTETDVITLREKYIDPNDGREKEREITELPDNNMGSVDCGTVNIGVSGVAYTWDVTDYVVNAGGDYSFSFKTSDPADVNVTLHAHGTEKEPYLIIVARPYIIDSSDAENVKVSTKYSGSDTAAQKFIVAQYDAKETMLSIQSADVKSNSEPTLTFTPDDSKNTRFYQFESLESAVPVKSSYKYRIGTTDLKAESTTVEGISVNGTKVTAYGKAEAGENVGITVADPEGSLANIDDLVYVGQTTADENGYYTITFNMPDDASVGMYDYAIGGSASGNLVTSQFYYAKPSTPASEVFSYLAGCDNTEDAGNIISSASAKLGLNGNSIYDYFMDLDDEKKETVLQGVVDELDPSDGTEELIDIITKNIVNGASSSVLNNFIEKTADDLLPAAYAEKFNDLSVTEKGDVCKKARGTYETAKGFIGKVKNEIDNVISERKTSTSGGSGGSGSGSSKNSNTYKEVVQAVWNNTPTPAPTEAPYTRQFFYDLDGYDWAEQAINDLATKGIVAGDGSGKFYPGNNVTREEFVKMLIIGFGLRDYSATCDFDDVSESDWYYEFVAAANKLGIVKGMSETEFGVGRNITRQDMAVMVYRAATVAGKTLADGEINFTDNDDIAEYAAAPVGAMQASGIITGMGDGTFAPLSNANRAQAAVIISRILGK